MAPVGQVLPIREKETRLERTLATSRAIETNEELRVVQMTPPGTACSISMVKGPGAPEMKPGSLHGLQITTSELRGARAELAKRGVEISEIQTYDQEARGFRPAECDLEVFNAFAFFNDPDGNGWAIQQGPARD